MLAPLEVFLPESYPKERQYILDTLFGDFLGLKYSLNVVSGLKETQILCRGKTVLVQDGLFSVDLEDWLCDVSMPELPLKYFDVSDSGFSVALMNTSLPVIYGEPYIATKPSVVDIGIDIFGVCFFMLSRYEEHVYSGRDAYGRSMACDSIAYKSGFLLRPIVNEYLEVIWGAIHHLLPEIKRKKRSYSIVPSHDVDRPFEYLNVPFLNALQYAAEYLVIKKQFFTAVGVIWRCMLSKMTLGVKDRYNTFAYIMNVSDRNSLKSSFHFISKSRNFFLDSDYSINDPSIIELLKEIDLRGHYVGLHPSYDSVENHEFINEEFQLFKMVCKSLSIHSDRWLSRQHYLRFYQPETARALEFAGVDVDSTMYYAESPGFRSGCCYEYKYFDLLLGRALDLVESPMILMDSSIIDGGYLDVSYDEKINIIDGLKKTCEYYNGQFVVLWHNSNLASEENRGLFERSLFS